MKDSRKIKQYLIILEEELYKLQSKNKLLPSIYTETKYNLEILLVDFQGNQIDKLKDQVYREDTWKTVQPCYQYIKNKKVKSKEEQNILILLNTLKNLLQF
ncbi:TPA: hypothetical protein IAA87_02910 [Candidatus Avigastranaerophilus faecigallinarum]|nr:hypothetical protein [Candidatus Avigastranaerophilus faecigallinarum]